MINTIILLTENDNDKTKEHWKRSTPHKEHKSERMFLLLGICSIHTAKEPANVLKKFNAEAKILWISNILNNTKKQLLKINDKLQYV